jgi:hypothetical protein
MLSRLDGAFKFLPLYRGIGFSTTCYWYVKLLKVIPVSTILILQASRRLFIPFGRQRTSEQQSTAPECPVYYTICRLEQYGDLLYLTRRKIEQCSGSFCENQLASLPQLVLSTDRGEHSDFRQYCEIQGCEYSSKPNARRFLMEMVAMLDFIVVMMSRSCILFTQ